MNSETSAGGIIIKNIGSGWLVLILNDMNGNWTFPKGIIEPGEEPEASAIREIGEETGIKNLKKISKLSPIAYDFERNAQKIHKIVHYFLFESNGNESLVPQREEGISEILWIPLEEAHRKLGYPETNIPLIEEAQRKLAL